MKIKETITKEELMKAFSDSQPIGIFKTLFFLENPKLYELSLPLSIQFYLHRSGEKTAGIIYDRLYEIIKLSEEGLTEDDIITFTNLTISQTILKPKYYDKWLRVYQILAEEQYNALYDEEYEEIKDGSYNITTTYDTEVENDGNVGTHETRTYTSETANDVYGFNSTSPVSDNVSEDSSSETVEGLAEKNTSHNKQSKTGTDSKVNDYDEKINRKGRNKTPSELLQMELDFRNRQTIMSIILKDIDDELTLKIY